MNRWQRRLQQSSRSRGFLWRFALGMLLAGAVVGYTVSRLSPAGSRDMAERIALSMAGNASPADSLVPGVLPFGAVAALEKELRDPAVEYVHVLDFMPTLATWSYPGEDGAIEAVLATRFTAGKVRLAMDLLAASRGGSEAEARLRDASESADPPRYAAYARGLLEMERRAYRAAYVHFRQEGERPEAEEARRRAIATLTAVRDWNEIQRLKDDPAYAALIAPSLSLQLAIYQQDWAEIVRRVPGAQIANLNAGILLLMLVTAIAWGFFLAHLGEFSAAPAGHVMLCLLALVAGAVSTMPTILAVIWQDEFLHFSAEGDMLRSFLY